jgi:MOSC domain-containing protein YiiM
MTALTGKTPPAGSDPADWGGQDLINTLKNLEYFLDRALDGNFADAADLHDELMAELRTLAADTGTHIPADATLAQANALLTQRFAARDGDVLARAGVDACVRAGIDIARRAGRRRRAAMTGRGEVVGLFRSGGGVPKLGVDTIDIGWRGVAGDVQAHRQHHGRAFQAVCLWSADVIDALRIEGHPVSPGSVGENVTVRGLDWPAIRPGTRLGLGSALLEVSSYATPCSQIAGSFTHRAFNRINEDDHPGWARIYGWVLRPGVVSIGDAVIVEPEARNAR